MQSGTNWVATDWYMNQRQQFSWSANINVAKRSAVISWNMTSATNNTGSPTYFVCHGNQTLSLKYGSSTWRNVVNIGPMYSGSIYNGFADKNSWLDKHYNRTNYFDINGDYVGIRRWMHILGTRWKTGSFTVYYDASGQASFSVTGNFAWFNSTRRTFSKTFAVSGIANEKYTISYNLNKDNYNLINVSSDITDTYKYYNNSARLSSNIPTSFSYDFIEWNTKADGTGQSYTSGASISSGSLNANTTLYAIWKAKKFEYLFKLNGGRTSVSDLTSTFIPALYTYLGGSYSNRIEPVSENKFLIPYNSDLKCPENLYKDGYTFSGYNFYNKLYQNTSNLLAHINITSVTNEEVNAEYIPNKYNLNLYDSVSNQLIRTIRDVTFDDYIYGDFSYEKLGYKVNGWTMQEGLKPYTLADIIPEDVIYIGNNTYTKNNPSTTLYQIPRDINLYTVLTYLSTFYVYTNAGWKLVLPYVKTDAGWKIALGYEKMNDGWKL